MPTRELGTETFPGTPESARAARRWLTERLGSAHPAHDDAVLLLSEAVTNSVLHSTGGKVEVSVLLDEQAVRVEVVDEGGDTLPHYVDDPCGEGGRGLPIMRALASEWGYELVERGLKVWFTVRPLR